MIDADKKYRVLCADSFDSAPEQQLLASFNVHLYKTDLEIVFPYIIIKSNNGNFDMIRIIIAGTLNKGIAGIALTQAECSRAAFLAQCFAYRHYVIKMIQPYRFTDNIHI